MGNYITLAITALTAIPIFFGFLFGIMRGSRHSVLRLCLVLLCIVLAFALRGAVATIVLNTEITIDGTTTTINTYLTEMLAEMLEGADLSNLVIPIVQSLAQVFVFLILYLVLRFITWLIIYPICKLFVRYKKDELGKRKKHRIIGGAIGLVQGFVCALCLCLVLTGVLVQANNVMVAVNDMQGITDEQAVTYSVEEDPGEAAPNDNGLNDVLAMLGDFVESPICNFYNSIGAKPFSFISQVKLENGNKITLAGQIRAVTGVIEMAKELTAINEIDFEGLQNGNAEDVINDIQDIFGKLQAIKEDMPEEALNTIQEVLNSVADSFDLPVDFSQVDIANVDFVEEGEILADLFEYTTKEEFTEDDAKQIVEKIAESNLILPVLESIDMDIGSQLDEEQKQVISDSLDELAADIDPAKLESIKNILGLN